ncbi:MAG: amino acid adenylation domain-containing protein [Acidobacteriota bacterium]
MSRDERHTTGLEIAVLSAAGRFPGAEDVETLWQRLREGRELLTHFRREEIQARGADPSILEDPSFVPSAGQVENIDLFDAELFGYTPREAEVLDPQHRLLLECAWEAMERAGYRPGDPRLAVGVYAGSRFNDYLVQLFSRQDIVRDVGAYLLMLANDRDYLATRISYKLDLQGPSVVIQTACSTSLVAVHMACQGLLAGECDLALAGGVSLLSPSYVGHRYTEGAIFSPDGHCRPFDEQARGTVAGSGLGLVVLKRLDEALEDGDDVLAVIRGSAINNDGAGKVGYTAPSVAGQSRAIRAAQELAEVDPATLTYVEAHGTATPLGDPIEIAALTRTFRRSTDEQGFCTIGSLKSNVGHLDPAAGIAGLIKTVLMLQHGEIPPSLHYRSPNPRIELGSSPFRVATELQPWEVPGGGPRRAGVSSFGIGGTNAHAVLEEAPRRPPSGPASPQQLILLSARSEAALDAQQDRLSGWWEKTFPAAEANSPNGSSNGFRNPSAQERLRLLADASFTLAVGRKELEYRRAFVCEGVEEGRQILLGQRPEALMGRRRDGANRPLVFLFSGQGSQYPAMGRELYETEESFRQVVDRAHDHLGEIEVEGARGGLRDWLYGERADAAALRATVLAQPALFTLEVALATWLESLGLEAEGMAGHSIGELAAAHRAGVMSFDDALTVVAARGRLMQSLPPGAMISLPWSPQRAQRELPQELDLAAINGPGHVVAAGDLDAIDGFCRRLDEAGQNYRRLHTSHAFHSRAMEPILDAFGEVVSGIPLRPPERPFLSAVDGRPADGQRVTRAQYWVQQLRRPVDLAAVLQRLFEEPDRILVEIGPGRALATLARRHDARPAQMEVLSTLPSAPASDGAPASDRRSVLETLGRLWLAGAEVRWSSLFSSRRQRISMPTYPFQRQRYWIEGRSLEHALEISAGGPEAPVDAADAEGRASGAAAGDGDSSPPGLGNRPPLASSFAPPRGERERQVAQIWSRLLGIDPIGLHDNFFELGGSSLVATQLAARLRETLEVDLALSDLLENPTVGGLTAVLERQLERSEGAPRETLAAIEPDTERRHLPFPLTDVQQAYWIGRGDALELGNVSTYAYTEVELEGFDLDRFQRALRRVIERQGMLRAVFLEDGRQRIRPVAEVPPYEIGLRDLDGLPAPEAEEILLAARERMSHQVLDSAEGPLFEVFAHRLGAGHYRLHFGFDFLLGDAWSLEILLAELGRFYADPERPVPELELSFRDYVLAEVALEESALHRASLEYWRGRLDTLPSGPELPLAGSLEQVERPHFSRRHGVLDAERWQTLRQRAGRHGLTPSALLATVFSELLSRWSQRPRFTLSLTLFNRLPLHHQVDQLIGDFTSLILLEVDTESPGTFGERVQRLQQRLWRDLDHSYVSGVRVVRELSSSAGRVGALQLPVVFTSLLGLTDDERRQQRQRVEEGLTGRTVYSVSQTPQVILDHQVEEREGRLSFNWDAVESVFPPGLLDDLFVTYQQLLAHLADCPEAWDEELSELLPRAHGELYDGVNDTALEPSNASLHGLFLERAAASPQAPAVLWSQGTLSYGELERRSAALAAALLTAGVEPGEVVAVVLEKGWRQAVATLAVLRAGAAYLPLDPQLPEARRHKVLELGGVRVALTRQPLGDSLTWPSEVRWLAVPTQDAGTAEPAPSVAVKPTDLAYVIFTSGSTGVPKGVEIDHRGAVGTLLDINRRYGVGAEDRVLALSSLGFDLSVYDLFGTFAAGAAVVYPEPWKVPDPQHWSEVARRHGVTLWNSVPALLEILVEHAGERRELLPSTLRLALLSGDWIPVSLPQRLQRLVPAAQVVSLGGATEASIWSIYHEVTAADRERASIPYGRPLSNQTFQVLDHRLQRRPLWVAGDLYIGGLGVALGYRGDQERTAAAFLHHPGTGERLYRTGDRGRWLPQGEIEFLGRQDQQVKVLGHRIELGEIEAHLLRHPEVESAVAGVWVEDRSRQRLVAWVVLRSEREGVEAVSATELQQQLEQRLPSYMVPKDLVLLPELPLTANGKVDRRALPAPAAQDAAGAAGAAYRQAGAAPTVQLITSLVEEVLELPRVQGGDNFFALGGHSLLATTLLSRVRSTFGVELPLRSVFESEDLAALARKVESERRRLAKVVVPPVTPRPVGEEPVLSYPQARLWFLKRLVPQSPVYNVNLGMRASGRLLLPALEASLDTVVARHEALRSVFPEVGGEPKVRILEPAPVPLAVVDLSALSPAQRDREQRRLVDRELVRPVDLELHPMLRITLLRLEAEDHVFLGMTHHIIWDDWSEGIFWYELGTLYRARVEGREVQLPELSVQYSDYASWQQSWFESEVMDRQLDYWSGQLQGAPRGLELPVDRPRPTEQTFHGRTVVIPLPADLLAAVEALGRRRGATVFMVALACYKTLLARLAGQKDLVVGTLVGNRNRPEIEPVIGFFVNTLALRTEFAAATTFGEVLERVRAGALGAYDHQDLPMERLLEELKLPRDLARNPLIQVIFNQFSAGRRRVELPDLTFEGVGGEVGWAPFDLTLTLLGDESQQVLHLQYATDLYDSTTVSRWMEALRRLMTAVVESPDAPLELLDLLRPAQRHQLLVEWNEGHRPLPPQASVVDLFSAWATADPQAPAVFDGEGVFSYREIDQASRQLAGYLRQLGVDGEQPVAVALGRSLRLVTTFLAILRAGGVYVPLDPEYPDERLTYMLEDSGCRILITEGDLQERIDDWLATLPPQRSPLRLCLDGDDARIRATPGNLPLPPQHPDQLAYLVYTSGSTGRPKGVAIPHRGIVRLVWRQRYFTLGPGDRMAMVSSASFDATTFELWAPLAHGAALVVLTQRELLSPQSFEAALRSYGFDTLFLTTAGFNGLARQNPAIFRTLRQLYFGGEDADAALVREVLEGAPPKRLVHVYGPTESTTFATFDPLHRVSPGARSVPIGRPLENTAVYVTDRRGLALPTGCRGEVRLGGEGLARGYWNRPGRTAEVFVPDEFGPLLGGRVYRTGDQGHLLADGRLVFAGREDRQIKLRGYRIELGEIEAALREQPGVREAVVVVHSPTASSRQLVAYYETADAAAAGGDEGAGQLRNALRSRLPEPMVPQILIPLEAFPLNANGKIDRAALPAPELPSSGPSATLDTPLQQLLARLWQEVLQVPEVGLRDNIFDLGADSILTIQIAARARDAGIELAPNDLFHHQTLEALAQHLEGAGSSAMVDQRPAQGEGPPLPIQRWFLERRLPAPHHFNQALVFEVRQHLSGACLADCVRSLAQHHDALRSRFRQRGEDWQLTVAPVDEGLPKVWEVDLSALPETLRSGALEELGSGLQRSFDLAQGSLLCALLVRWSAGSDSPPAPAAGTGDRLLLCAHHLVVDGVSWRLLLEDLWSLWTQWDEARGARQAFSPLLPARTTSVLHWGLALEHAADSMTWEERSFWLDAAAESSSALALPRLPVSGAEVRERGSRTIVSEVDDEVTAQLLGPLRGRSGLTPDELLMTSLLRALRQQADGGSVAGFGADPATLRLTLERHGRDESLAQGIRLGRTVGWLTSAFPVTLEGSAEGGAEEDLARCRDALRRIPGEGVGYGLLRWGFGAAQDRATLAARPEPEIAFNYLGQLDRALPAELPLVPGSDRIGESIDPDAERWPRLAVDARVLQGCLHVSWTYGEDLDPAWVQGLASGFCAQVSTLVTLCLDPATRLPDLGAEDAAEDAAAAVDLSDDEISRLFERLS